MNVPFLSFCIGEARDSSSPHQKGNSINKETSTAAATKEHRATENEEAPPTEETAPESHSRRKRIPWTKEEDAILIKLVKEEGLDDASLNQATSFVRVAEQLPSGRNSKQCRDRWRNILRKGIKKGEWTHEEEELIRTMYLTFGPKWATMSKILDGRTDGAIKNKWNSMKRKEDRKANKVEQPAQNCIDANPTHGFQPQDYSGGHKKRRVEY